MHPTTIGPGILPERFANIISLEPARTKAAFLYALADDLYEQAIKDKKRGYVKIAQDMTNALPYLKRAANNTSNETIDDHLKNVITPYAKDVGVLRYDAMMTFLETYATITKERALLNAAHYVQEAWKHTPRSWKETYAPETLKRNNSEIT